MWQKVNRLRKVWLLLGICSGLVVLIGSVTALTRLDLERHQCDPERMDILATTDLPIQEPGKSIGRDWPQWRGPNRDGLSMETGLLKAWPPTGPEIVWRRLIGRGFSSVAVADGRLYTMETVKDAEANGPQSAKSEAVVCLDASTGNDIWRFGYHNDFDERFGSGPRSTPAVDGDYVYAVGPTGIFHCLRRKTGEKVWRHDLQEEFAGRKMQYGVSFSPLIAGKLVIATPGGPKGNSIAAFNKSTGELVWKVLDDPIAYSSPIAVTIGGIPQLLIFTNTELVSLSPANGKLYWSYPWKTDEGFNIATPVAFGNYIFISSAYGKGCALLEISAVTDGSFHASRVYEHNRMRNYFASSVRLGEYIYGFDMTDLVCMAVRTGQIIWREKGVRSFRKGSLLIADGQLVILGESGTLTLASATPAGYHEEAAFQVSKAKCWTVPALSAGKLYVRDESQIVCLNLRK